MSIKCATARLALRRYPPRSWLYVPHKMAARKNRRLSLSGRIGKRSRMSRFCSSSTWAERSKNISATRSEEHTSELQSRLHLVCRLLLEKKNTGKNSTSTDDSCKSD